MNIVRRLLELTLLKIAYAYQVTLLKRFNSATLEELSSLEELIRKNDVDPNKPYSLYEQGSEFKGVSFVYKITKQEAKTIFKWCTRKKSSYPEDFYHDKCASFDQLDSSSFPFIVNEISSVRNSSSSKYSINFKNDFARFCKIELMTIEGDTAFINIIYITNNISQSLLQDIKTQEKKLSLEKKISNPFSKSFFSRHYVYVRDKCEEQLNKNIKKISTSLLKNTREIISESGVSLESKPVISFLFNRYDNTPYYDSSVPTDTNAHFQRCFEGFYEANFTEDRLITINNIDRNKNPHVDIYHMNSKIGEKPCLEKNKIPTFMGGDSILFSIIFLYQISYESTSKEINKIRSINNSKNYYRLLESQLTLKKDKKDLKNIKKMLPRITNNGMTLMQKCVDYQIKQNKKNTKEINFLKEFYKQKQEEQLPRNNIRLARITAFLAFLTLIFPFISEKKYVSYIISELNSSQIIQCMINNLNQLFSL